MKEEEADKKNLTEIEWLSIGRDPTGLQLGNVMDHFHGAHDEVLIDVDVDDPRRVQRRVVEAD